jgi:hypothetical protein
MMTSKKLKDNLKKKWKTNSTKMEDNLKKKGENYLPKKVKTNSKKGKGGRRPQTKNEEDLTKNKTT